MPYSPGEFASSAGQTSYLRSPHEPIAAADTHGNSSNNLDGSELLQALRDVNLPETSNSRSQIHAFNKGTTVSNTASEQHQQEKELLSKFAIPNPPVSTQSYSGSSENGTGTSTNLNSTQQQHRTLWMGDLDPWLEESGLEELWWNMLKKRVTAKIIKPKSRRPETTTYQGLTHSGYCFIEFESHDDAHQALALNGSLLPDSAMPSQQQYPNNPDNQKKYFRINWANAVTLDAPIVQSPEYPVFVGDLSASTTEAHLLAFFQRKFPTSIKAVRVMTDSVSGKSKCYGFVRFTEDSERARALVEMPGALLGGRHIRVKLANPKNRSRPIIQNEAVIAAPEFASSTRSDSDSVYSNPQFNQFAHLHSDNTPSLDHYTYGDHDHHALAASGYSSSYSVESTDQMQREPSMRSEGPNSLGITFGWNRPAERESQEVREPPQQINTSVFVGALSSEATEATLYSLFAPFGLIQQVRVLPGSNCGFIKYTTREQAETAISSMQGYNILGNCIRLSWGRSASNRRVTTQHSQKSSSDKSFQYNQKMQYGQQGYFSGNQENQQTQYEAQRHPPNHTQQSQYYQVQNMFLGSPDNSLGQHETSASSRHSPHTQQVTPDQMKSPQFHGNVNDYYHREMPLFETSHMNHNYAPGYAQLDGNGMQDFANAMGNLQVVDGDEGTSGPPRNIDGFSEELNQRKYAGQQSGHFPAYIHGAGLPDASTSIHSGSYPHPTEVQYRHYRGPT